MDEHLANTRFIYLCDYHKRVYLINKRITANEDKNTPNRYLHIHSYFFIVHHHESTCFSHIVSYMD
jgi:hypothetical protein